MQKSMSLKYEPSSEPLHRSSVVPLAREAGADDSPLAAGSPSVLVKYLQ